MSEQEKGGAAIFIAGLEKGMSAAVADAEKRRDDTLRRILATLQAEWAEETKHEMATGEFENVDHARIAALGTILGSANAALGLMFKSANPSMADLIKTVHNAANVFASWAQGFRYLPEHKQEG